MERPMPSMKPYGAKPAGKMTMPAKKTAKKKGK
jgi:hypothetical protein